MAPVCLKLDVITIVLQHLILFQSNLSVKNSCEDTETSTVDNKENKTEELNGESKDNPEDKSELHNHDDSLHHIPMDAQSVDTVEQVDSQEQKSESPNVGWRRTVPLSERFSQLTDRPAETVDGSDETKFKAEFESIINRLNRNKVNCGSHKQAASDNEQNEEMDVDTPLDGSNDVKDSEKVDVGNDVQLKSKDSEEVNKQTDSMSNDGLKEKVEGRRDVERNATSPGMY